MESIQGKKTLELDAPGLARRMTGYQHILIDIGAGDGRLVRYLAGLHPDWFCIGIDACRENLRAVSREALPNALYLIASAQALPEALHGYATHLTINFPWGSLLQGLLEADPALIGGLQAIARPSAVLDIRLNGGALAETGWQLQPGARQVQAVLAGYGWRIKSPVTLDAQALRNLKLLSFMGNSFFYRCNLVVPRIPASPVFP